MIAHWYAFAPFCPYSATGAENKSIMYYTNDGVYGSFNCIMFDHAVAEPLPLTQNSQMLADEVRVL